MLSWRKYFHPIPIMKALYPRRRKATALTNTQLSLLWSQGKEFCLTVTFEHSSKKNFHVMCTSSELYYRSSYVLAPTKERRHMVCNFLVLIQILYINDVVQSIFSDIGTWVIRWNYLANTWFRAGSTVYNFRLGYY